ncbi:MAG: ChaN family lipoprotein, partial [Flammeovirgaceae bacterium]|nr:ChaN family lipoprotein [Flammeovirgaceae bacterium]MDW8288852.1 ChaN family lipoprotein [Flammeovirgaceae bacterium]
NATPSDNFPKAQALKDATMAHFILKNLPEKGVFLHYHGTYHSNNFEGIYWYLKRKKNTLHILTIASVEQADIQQLAEENKNLANFVLVIPTTMTKTY